MTVPFASVPNNVRVPFFAVEFDPSRASQGPSLLAYSALLIGQKITAGTATANTIVRCTSANQAATLAGRGSQLHRMAIAWFANNKYTECWLGVLDDNGAGVAATKTLTVTGPATAAGTIYLYIGGQQIPVAVASGDSANAIATAINTAIANAQLEKSLPVTGGVLTNVVTLTARNKGVDGQNLDVRVNYRDGETLPSGVGVAVANSATGATNPVLTTLIDVMGDRWFQIIVHPYYDATSLLALETELSSRFGPMRAIDGLLITSSPGSQSTLSTLGETRNSPHSIIMSQPGVSPVTPPAEFAAAVGAQAALSLANDPAQPLQTLALAGVLPPATADEFTVAERNLMLFDGIGTSRVVAGTVQIERVITTYRLNASGGEDDAYLRAETMATLLYLRYSWRQNLLSKYGRHKLADDGTRAGAGQKIMTPSLGRAEAVAWFEQMETLGLVEGVDQFKRDLIVERNASNVDRLDWLMPPDLVNQFVVGATNLQFLL